MWYEHMSRDFETIKSDVFLSKLGYSSEVEITVEYLRTEYWSSEDSKSKYYYEYVGQVQGE